MTSSTQPGGVFAELLLPLTFASDLNMGLSIEHTLRTVWVSVQLAHQLRLSHDDQVALYYGGLLKDSGCTACAASIAASFGGDDITVRRRFALMDPDSMAKDMGQGFTGLTPDPALPESLTRVLSSFVSASELIKEAFVSHCEMGGMLAQRLGLPENARHTIRYLWEQWDGKGAAYGLRGPQIPATSRLLRVAQVVEVAYQLGGEATATETVLRRRGKDLDPDMVDAYMEASKRVDFWSPPDAGSVQQAVVDIRPRVPNEEVTDSQVENACQAVADFVDIRSPSHWGHSRATAEVAEGIARRLGLDEATVTRVRRAALVHDLGNFTVPCSVLEKQGNFSADEWESLRLHPYYTERILSRVGLFKDLAQEAVAHHERVDGGGYHRSLNRDQTTLSQRILALADTYTDLANRQAQGTDIESLLRQMEPLVGSQIDSECHQGLLAYLQGAPVVAGLDTQSDHNTRAGESRSPPRIRRDPSPFNSEALARVIPAAVAPRAAPGAKGTANLSRREIEVLRALVKGLRNREVAQQLVISEKTVERHLENIYNKLDITSRTSAVVYAVQNGLIK